VRTRFTLGRKQLNTCTQINVYIYTSDRLVRNPCVETHTQHP
jgi:hypothetical protein